MFCDFFWKAFLTFFFLHIMFQFMLAELHIGCTTRDHKLLLIFYLSDQGVWTKQLLRTKQLSRGELFWSLLIFFVCEWNSHYF